MKTAAIQGIVLYTEGYAGLRRPHLHPNVLSQLVFIKITDF